MVVASTIKHMLRAFWIALQFLTRLPTPDLGPIHAEDKGRSLLAYPAVGLVLAGLLCVAAAILPLGDLVMAAVLLVLWVSLSGALHLDGLADSADAWLGGYGDRERTLRIMKDPACGPAGVVVLVLLLLSKFALLASLADELWLGLLLAPVLARAAVLVLFKTTPYARMDGIGYEHAQHMPAHAARGCLLAVVVFTLFCAGWQGMWILLLLLCLIYALRALMLERLGGTTGDTAGAMIELVELAVLLALFLF